MAVAVTAYPFDGEYTMLTAAAGEVILTVGGILTDELFTVMLTELALPAGLLATTV